jgi:hypothetical protein
MSDQSYPSDLPSSGDTDETIIIVGNIDEWVILDDWESDSTAHGDHT